MAYPSRPIPAAPFNDPAAGYQSNQPPPPQPANILSGAESAVWPPTDPKAQERGQREALAARLAALWGVTAEQAMLKLRMAGEQDARVPLAKGHMVGPVFVRANPLQQALGAGLNIASARRAAALSDRYSTLDEEQGAARGAANDFANQHPWEG